MQGASEEGQDERIQDLKDWFMHMNPDYVEWQIQGEIERIGIAVRAAHLDGKDFDAYTRVTSGVIQMTGTTELTNFIARDREWRPPRQRHYNLKYLTINDVLLTIYLQCTIHYGPAGPDKVRVVDLSHNDIRGTLNWIVVHKFKNLRKLNLHENFVPVRSYKS